MLHDGLKDILDADAFFSRAQGRLFGVQGEFILDLVFDPVYIS